MKKKYIFLVLTFSFLFTGCTVEKKSIEDENEVIESNEILSLEKEIGLEKIIDLNHLLSIYNKIGNSNFVNMRKNKLKVDYINKDITLKCSNRAYDIASKFPKEEKIPGIKVIGEIDRIGFVLNEEEIKDLIKEIVIVGDNGKIIEKDFESKEILESMYLTMILDQCINNSLNFSYEEKLLFLRFLEVFRTIIEHPLMKESWFSEIRLNDYKELSKEVIEILNN